MQQKAGHYQTRDKQPRREDKCLNCRKASAGAYSLLLIINSWVQTHMNLLNNHAAYPGGIDIITVMKNYKYIYIYTLSVYTHKNAQTHKYTLMYICRGKLWGFNPCSSCVAIKFMTIWSLSVNHSDLHHDRNNSVLAKDNMKYIKEKSIVVTLMKIIFIFWEESWLHRITDLINVFNLLISPLHNCFS